MFSKLFHGLSNSRKKTKAIYKTIWQKQFDSKKSQYQKHKVQLKEILIIVDNLLIKGEQVMGSKRYFRVMAEALIGEKIIIENIKDYVTVLLSERNLLCSPGL